MLWLHLFTFYILCNVRAKIYSFFYIKHLLANMYNSNNKNSHLYLHLKGWILHQIKLQGLALFMNPSPQGIFQNEYDIKDMEVV